MMKQHFVPKMYLNNFGQEVEFGNNPRDYKIYAYSLSSNEGRYTVTRNVAKQAGYNDFQLTDRLFKLISMPGKNIGDIISFEEIFTYIENKTAPILKKLAITKSVKQIPLKDRRWLSYYLSYQLYRVPNTRMLFQRTIDKSRSKEITPNFSEAMEDSEEFLKFIWSQIMKTVVFDITDYLFSLHWIIGTCVFGTYLHTSDNPIVLYSPGEKPGEFGIKTPWVQLVFPLSRYCALIMCNKNFYDTVINEITINPSEASALKVAMIEQATEHLFAYCQSDLEI